MGIKSLSANVGTRVVRFPKLAQGFHLNEKRIAIDLRSMLEAIFSLASENGHPLLDYPYVPSEAKTEIVNYAILLGRGLALLKPDHEDVTHIYNRLDRIHAMLLDEVPIDNTVCAWRCKAMADYETSSQAMKDVITANKPGWHRHNPIQDIKEKEVTNPQWQPGVRKGFDRSVRRPQSHYPVLTIELPNGNPPAGCREDIAEHLRLIGYAVKFVN